MHILKRIHEEEIRILDEIDRVCKNNQIQYFLDCIENNDLYYLPFGKVRLKNTIMEEKANRYYTGNKGIWVDIFPLDNAKKERSIIQKIKYKLIVICRYIISQKIGMIENIKLTRKVLNKISKIFSIRKLIKLINWIAKVGSNQNNKYFINYSSRYGINRQTHLKSMYYPSTKLKFEKREYMVPKNYEEILIKIYGDNYMELPPEEKRITHDPVRIKLEDGEEYKFEQ